MSESIIFYSMRCKHSMKALEIIKNNNININLECIDNNKNLPKFLKVVPTIIEKNCDKPLEGDFVFNWLNRFVKSSSSSSSSNMTQKPIESNESIQPFFSNEMTGYSDGYSYISNENPMDHSFQFLNNNQNNNQNNNNQNNNIYRPMSSNNETNDDFNKMLQSYKEARDNQLPAPISRR